VNTVHEAVRVFLQYFNPSASTSIRGIDLCFFTCYWPLYVA